MPNRIFVDQTLTENSTLSLADQAAHHVARVLRMRVGDPLVLFNGLGGEFQARIDQISKSSVEVSIENFVDVDRESPLSITLMQGVSRGEKMDFTIQKAVELGVARIMPITTQHGNVQLDAKRWTKKHDHWQKTIISACEQCGRNKLPILEAAQPLSQSLLNLEDDNIDLGLILDPVSDQTLSDYLSDQPDFQPKKISFVIGPEGGLSPDEISRYKDKGFVGIKLGPRILRTETAALAVLAMLQSQFGDFC